MSFYLAALLFQAIAHGPCALLVSEILDGKLSVTKSDHSGNKRQQRVPGAEHSSGQSKVPLIGEWSQAAPKVRRVHREQRPFIQ